MRILITGARSGIAYGVAKKLIRHGHSLYLCTHTEKECEALKRRLADEGLSAVCMKVDVTNISDLEKIEKMDIDCLINHAGVGISGSLLDMDISCLKEVYDVNIFSNFLLLQKVYQHMEKRGTAGKIFVTSSLASMLPFPYLSAYTSSKAAISMIISTMRKELVARKSSVRISLIEPGAYHTGFNQRMIDQNGDILTLENRKQIQRNLFALIEKYDLKSIVFKIVREVEKKNPKFHIRTPLMQVLSTKLYLLFFR